MSPRALSEERDRFASAAKQGGRGNAKGEKEEEMLLPLSDPMHPGGSMGRQDAHLSRAR